MTSNPQDGALATPNGAVDRPANSGELFGHPKGLYVLFFTEMWERFSFYGMRALLILYMLNHFFWTQEDASQLMGWYAFLAYALPVFGGLIADKWLGARRTVVLGALILSAGHLLMAFEPKPFFFTALGLIVVGVGLLKPNISTQVGALYKPGDHRRDGAFTIFYMGINIGAFLGPIVCDWLRVNYGYHYGFAAAGVGMMFGLFVYVLGQRKLREFNQEPVVADKSGTSALPPHVVRARIIVLLVIFAFVILFWMAFEQSSNAMVVWADQFTNLQLFSTEASPVMLDGVATGEAATGLASLEITAGATQAINPMFIIILASPLAFLWTKMDKRGIQPSTPAKMMLGIAGVSGAFLVMVPAASFENRPSQVSLASLPDRVDLSQFGATRLTYDEEARELHLQGVLPENDRLRMLAATAPVEFAVAVAAVEGAFSNDEFLHVVLPSAPSSLNSANDESEEAFKWDDSTRTLSVSAEFDEEARKRLLDSVGEGAFRTELEDALDAVNDVNVVRTETGEVTAVLASAPPSFRIVGDEAEQAFTWDDATKTLTVSKKINERARIQLLAMAGDPTFKEAVDELYVKTSKFRISIWWLMLHYMLATLGELCLSPVGLSLVTKLAPPKHVGLFMGGWFLSTAIAEKLAHVLGGMWGNMTPTKYFMIFVVVCGIGALLLATLVPTLKRMMYEET